MKVGVITFPGTNCNQDMSHAFKHVLGMEVVEVWHKDEALDTITSDDLVVIPGGFSYGDYVRSGAVANLSPIMKAVKSHAAKGGKVLGICNGFQILCEAGLLPGVLLRNENQHFIGITWPIKVESTNSYFTAAAQRNDVVELPCAHAEGRYFADEETIQNLKDNDQILFRYCESNGDITEQGNLNGSVESIAGICNKERNVIGMMPHPERAAETILNNTDGISLLYSICHEAKVC